MEMTSDGRNQTVQNKTSTRNERQRIIEVLSTELLIREMGDGVCILSSQQYSEKAMQS